MQTSTPTPVMVQPHQLINLPETPDATQPMAQGAKDTLRDMKTLWCETYGLGLTEALQEAWRIQIETLEALRTGQQHHVQVIPAETGTGKSTLMRTYLTHLPPAEGALVVVPFIKMVDEIAEKLNDAYGEARAVGYHSASEARSEYQGRMDDLRKMPIVVITHAQYLKILQSGEIPRWFSYQGKPRLCLIDEYLSGLYGKTVITWDRLTALKAHDMALGLNTPELDAYIDKHLRQAGGNLDAIRLGKDVIELLQQPWLETLLNETRKLAQNGGTWLSSPECLISKASRIQALRTALEAHTDDLRQLKPAKTLELHHHFQHPLPTAVFDATAALCPLYQHPAYEIVSLPRVKRYENLTLVIHPLPKDGKSALMQYCSNPQMRQVLQDELIHLGHQLAFREEGVIRSAEVLHIGHKGLISKLKGAPELQLQGYWDNYGNLVGRNDYQEIEVMAILGLFRPPVGDLDALGIPQKEYRKWQERMAWSDLVQAINRCKVRRMTEQGDCAPAEVHLWVKENEGLIKMLKHFFPGCVLHIEEPVQLPSKMPGPRSKAQQSFLAHVENLKPGQGAHCLNDIFDALKLTDGERKSIRKILREKTPHSLVQALRSMNVVWGKEGNQWVIEKWSK